MSDSDPAATSRKRTRFTAAAIELERRASLVKVWYVACAGDAGDPVTHVRGATVLLGSVFDTFDEAAEVARTLKPGRVLKITEEGFYR